MIAVALHRVPSQFGTVKLQTRNLNALRFRALPLRHDLRRISAGKLSTFQAGFQAGKNGRVQWYSELERTREDRA